MRERRELAAGCQVTLKNGTRTAVVCKVIMYADEVKAHRAEIIVEMRKRVAIQLLADGVLFDAAIGPFEFGERPLLLVPEMSGRGVVLANMNGGTA